MPHPPLPRRRPEPHRYDADPAADPDPVADDAHADPLHIGILNVLAYLLTRPKPKNTIRALLYALRAPESAGLSMQQCAERAGVTRQDFHHEVNTLRSRFSLPRSEIQKSPQASDRYRLANRRPI